MIDYIGYMPAPVTQCPVCLGRAYSHDWGIVCENCEELDNELVEKVAALRHEVERLLGELNDAYGDIFALTDGWD